MALVKYIGHKSTKVDNVAGTNTVWTGHGDVRSVPNKALEQILKHPTVWQLVSDDDLTTAAETALAGGLANAQPATVTEEATAPAEEMVFASKVRQFIDEMLRVGRLVNEDLPVVYAALGLGDAPAAAKPLPPDDADKNLAAEAAANAAAGLDAPKDAAPVAANMSHTNPENDEDGENVASRPGTLASPPGTVVEPPKANNTGRRAAAKA